MLYGLKDNEGIIVDVSEVTPTISAEGILFNNCLYPQVDMLSVVESIPDYAKPRRFKMVEGVFTPLISEMDAYETLIMNAAIDDYTMQLIDGGVL